MERMEQKMVFWWTATIALAICLVGGSLVSFLWAIAQFNLYGVLAASLGIAIGCYVTRGAWLRTRLPGVPPQT